MSRERRVIWSVIAVVFVVAVSAAAMTATEAITQRQKAMEANRDAIMVLGAIAKKAQPFDADVVHANAAKIAEDLEKAAELFPEGSEQGDVQTYAKPDIWSDREQFDQLLQDARQAAIDLQSVTEEDAFPSALGKLGNGCKSCHDLYRLPKN